MAVGQKASSGTVVPGLSPPVIRRAHRRDARAIAEMSAAFRAELGEPTAGLTERAVRRDGFGLRPEFEILLGLCDGEIAGYTLYFDAYEPNYSERGLYLADLYVRPEFRNRQVGRTLIACVAAESRRRKRSFVWWVALATNTPAQDFYERLGAAAVPVVAHAAFGPFFDKLAASAPPIRRR